MNRPHRIWCGVVAGLGVLAGCAQNSTDSGKTAPSGSGGAGAVQDSPLGSPGGVQVTPCKFDAVEKAVADAKGKVVLVDFWATWCPPCVASFPKLVEKHQKYGGKGLAVISVSLDEVEDADGVISFLRKQNAKFTNLLLTVDAAGQKGLKAKFAFGGSIPHAVLFDKSGKRVWAGHPVDPELTPAIEKELAKSGPVQG